VVSTDYIHVTYQLALQALVSESDIPPAMPRYTDYLILKPAWPTKPTFIDSSDSDSDAHRPSKRRRTADTSIGIGDGAISGKGRFAFGAEGPRAGNLPDIQLYPEDVQLDEIPKRCVERPSPLVCVNQDIVDAIKPIYEDREFEELAQKNSNVLSYRRSMSVRALLSTIYAQLMNRY
jgi:DNA polymerase mu